MDYSLIKADSSNTVYCHIANVVPAETKKRDYTGNALYRAKCSCKIEGGSEMNEAEYMEMQSVKCSHSFVYFLSNSCPAFLLFLKQLTARPLLYA